MGCGGSKESYQDKELSNKIDSQLYSDKAKMASEIKMLLLGAGESGKSTIIKQMKLIHDGGYSLEERESFKEIIYSNTIQSMHVLLEAMDILEIPLHNSELQAAVNLIMAVPGQVDFNTFDPQLANAIKIVWADPGLQQCYQRSNEFQLNDSANYYFDNITRISVANYTPSNEDVLRSRVKTTGISETTFRVGELTYRMLDVGGQRSERKKWIHCFENVTAILFLVAISEYDQVLIEDESVNRMQEALTLFDNICNSRWFSKTSIILFFNKIDLFRKKIPNNPLSNYFTDFEGGADPEAAGDYILKRFVSLNISDSKHIYTHFTCATDTNQIKFVMAAVNDIIIQDNLREVGII
ncbi:hypothetical protein BB561_002048 [Smittium simulii]|uniref:Guanine nucleotide-binding protein subunit alpha n=1 Tax=Smittium simulii TaxID=133385 RepID=A0A2T9YRY9_9FUNG|nr:hypothetical protein BB561_002048 [Smittium simulii]